MPDDNPASQVPEPPVNTTDPSAVSGKSKKKLPIWAVAALVIIVVVVGAFWHFRSNSKPANSNPTNSSSKSDQTTSSTANLPGLQLDPTKNYGNKYADGLLPVGDGRYVTSAPKTGYIYTCSGYANNIQVESGGAGKRGPWFTNNNTQYDINKKIHVEGSVMWQADFSNQVNGNVRTIVTNDLPSHPTGTFPISPNDPAYVYDRNPNSIKGQTLTYSLNANPTYNATPQCMGGQSGIMLTGIALFNGFDAGGRDAGAWEIQDSCDGHPQSEGIYHYHTLSSCIKDVNGKTVIGYALDGFPITGPKISDNNILTTDDLDECHGITSQIVLDGKPVTMYHYVMTQDFPYSVSCFRATPIQPPGQKPQPH
ncbi:MAG TPA: YHYH protein [Candidatus Saccharimonadales bacterium]|nr:YHYH protein [Candidatus Saccharimonadales bacterium]